MRSSRQRLAVVVHSPLISRNSWRPFTFGAGSFELALLTDLDVNKNNDATIYGSFRNAPELTLTAVPEPATLLLFGAGALGIASRMRQRR